MTGGKGGMRLAGVLLAGFGALSVASFLGRSWWGFELLAHFRPHYAALAAVFLVFFVVARRALAAAVAAVVLAAHALPLLPYLMPAAPAGAMPAPLLRVLTLNLHHRHVDTDAVQRLLVQERPDLVALTEVIPDQSRLLEALRPLYPHQIAALDGNLFDVVLLSRFPFVSEESWQAPGTERPVRRVRLCGTDGASCLTVVALHGARPLSEAAIRKRQLAQAARFAAEAGGRVVLLGDLNVTPWSPLFDDLLSVGGLRDSALGRGITQTWLSGWPFLGLPIDHVLVGSGIVALSRRVGPDVGSDHFPVIVDLAGAASGG